MQIIKCKKCVGEVAGATQPPHKDIISDIS